MFVFWVVFTWVISLSGCDYFNTPIPDYIDKYTNTAAGEKYRFTTTTHKEPSGKPYIVIVPGKVTELDVILRNPRRYALDPILEYWFDGDGIKPAGWYRDDDPVGGRCSLNLRPEEGSSRSVLITAKYEAHDKVHITFGDKDAFTKLPQIDDSFKLRLILKNELGIDFERFAFELPLLRCSKDPPKPVITDVVPAGNGALRVTWTLYDVSGRTIGAPVFDASDATGMTVSIQGVGSENYSQASWGTGKGTPSDPYKTVIFPYKNIQSAVINLTVDNKDGLTSACTFDYVYSNRIYVSNNGTGDGSSEAEPTNLTSALHTINNAPDNSAFTVICVAGTGSIQGDSLEIKEKRTVTLRSGVPSSNSIINVGDGNTGWIFRVSGTLILEGGEGTITLAGNNANTYPLIIVESGGSLIMKDRAVLTGNRNTGYAGGLNDNYGGAVGVLENGTFTMAGGIISDNEAKEGGGGVSVKKGTFKMEGGDIYSNEARNGGGVYVDQGTFEMVYGNIGGVIVNNGNIATGNGGGVYVASNGKFVMTGGLIGSDSPAGGNAAIQGGGVFYASESNSITNTISGTAEINYNNATDLGGGIFITMGGPATRVTMSENAKIIGNEVTAGTMEGGGVLVNGIFTMDGGLIQGNKAKNGAGIAMNIYPFEDSVNVTIKEGWIISNNASGYGGGILGNSNGNLTMIGGNVSSNTAENGAGVFINGQPSKPFVFEMSGGSIGGDALEDGNIATYSGSSEDQNIGGGGVYVHGIASLKLKGNAVIRYNRAEKGNGGGVHINSVGSCTMEGTSRIIDNRTTFGYKKGYGGGVYVGEGNTAFTMYGGTISTNTAGINGGGVAVAGGGTFTTETNYDNDLTISSNGSDRGGGIYVDRGTFTMDGGTIKDHTSTNIQLGGGVCAEGTITTPAFFEMKRGIITNNHAYDRGGGVYLDGNASDPANATTFTMRGGIISANAAGNSGGGVTVGIHAKFDMIAGTIGGSNANANTALNGGGVYVQQNGTFNMTGGFITYNVATNLANGTHGGVQLALGAAFNKTSGAIIDNNMPDNNP